jgi:hypothetical protein
VALALVLAACGGDEERAPTTGAGAPSAAFAAAGCPVDDPAACERASLVATGSRRATPPPALVELSYEDTFVRDDLPAETFPDCAPGETLEGHVVTGKIGTFSAEDHEAWLGEVAVACVGTCGPEAELACGNVEPWD